MTTTHALEVLKKLRLRYCEEFCRSRAAEGYHTLRCRESEEALRVLDRDDGEDA